MNTPLYAASLLTGMLVTMSGLKGIETQNIYRGLLFLLAGTVTGFITISLGSGVQTPENVITIIFAVTVSSLGSGLIVLFVDSEKHQVDGGIQ